MSLSSRKLASIASLFAAVSLGVTLSTSSADADNTDRGGGRFDRFIDPRVAQGLRIAPVPLNLHRKNIELVGLGAYLVNVFDCDGCHSAGPATQFAPGGNPYFGQKTVINPATYLGGGRDFGAFPRTDLSPTSSRATSRPVRAVCRGDLTHAEFRDIMRHGTDIDHAHPTCTGAPNGSCLPAPFNGDLLQIMPWPAYSNMTETDLRAIYEYLSSIPCLEGGPGQAPGRCS
jgi:hypothetical protein